MKKLLLVSTVVLLIAQLGLAGTAGPTQMQVWEEPAAEATAGTRAPFVLTPGALIGIDVTTSTLVLFDPDGNVLNTLVFIDNLAIGTPVGVAVLNGELWVAGVDEFVARVNLATGMCDFAFSSGTYIEGLGDDGTNLLTANFGSGTVSVFDTSGTLLTTVALASSVGATGIDSNAALIYEGAWSQPGDIFAFDFSGSLVGQIVTGLPSSSVSGVGYNNLSGNLWVSTGFASDEIIEFDAAGTIVSSFSASAAGFPWINGLDVVPFTMVGPMSEYYIADSNPDRISVVQGAAAGRDWTARSHALPIAVSDTVRTFGEYAGSGDFGSEYTLSGSWTGVDYPFLGTATGQLVDGTTDGVAHNWLISWDLGAVIQYDRSWANPVVLFTASEPTGLTYDSTTGHLWVISYTTQSIEEYTIPGGALVSSFPYGTGSDWLGCLAYEPATDTLWTMQFDTGELRQYSKGGAILQTLTIPSLVGFAWGGEFPIVSTMYAVDDPSDSLYRVATATGATGLVGSLVENLSFSGMAWDSWNDVMYVSDVYIVGGTMGYGLGSIDLETGVITPIGDHETSSDIHGLAFDSANNVLYGADVGNDGLAVIDRTTGAATFVGSYGASISLRGLAFSTITNTLYGIDQSGLYAIDAGTGAAVLVGLHGIPFDGVFMGLEFDSDSGILYAAGSGASDLYSMNVLNGVATAIGPTGLSYLSGLGSTTAPGAAGWVSGIVELQPVRASTAGAAVKAYEAGTSNLVASTTTDAAGNFTLVVPVGTYDVLADLDLYLAATYFGAVASGGTLSLPNVTLRGGDTDENGQVALVDVTYVASRFGSTTEPLADINASGIVDVVDVSATASNYGTNEPTPWP